VVDDPVPEQVQSDGRVRRWVYVAEEGHHLCAVLLADRDRAQRMLRPELPWQARKAMKVKYFEDTDTALLEFTDWEVAETRQISESIYVDLDVHGNVVNITIEHARTNANLPELGYEAMPERT